MPDKNPPAIQKSSNLFIWFCELIIIAAVSCFFFGVGHFRDGPIHPCEKDRGYFYKDHPYGYCGKQGQSHTAADFKSYQEWETITYVLWSLMMLSVASLVRQAKKRRI